MNNPSNVLVPPQNYVVSLASVHLVDHLHLCLSAVQSHFPLGDKPKDSFFNLNKVFKARGDLLSY